MRRGEKESMAHEKKEIGMTEAEKKKEGVSYWLKEAWYWLQFSFEVLIVAIVLFAALMVFVDFASASLQNYTQAHNVSLSSSQTFNAWGCVAVIPSCTGKFTNLSMEPTSTASRLGVLTTGGTPYSSNVISSCSLTGGATSCLLSANVTASGAEYYLCADAANNGVNYDQKYGTAGDGVPVIDSKLNWTRGVIANGNTEWVDQDNTLFEIIAATLECPVTLPAHISSFEIIGHTSTSISLQWTTTGDIRETDLTRDGTLIYSENTSGTTILVDFDLTPNTSYVYNLSVFSLDEDQGSESQNLTAITDAAPVTPPAAAAATDYTIYLLLIILLAVWMFFSVAMWWVPISSFPAAAFAVLVLMQIFKIPGHEWYWVAAWGLVLLLNISLCFLTMTTGRIGGLGSGRLS